MPPPPQPESSARILKLLPNTQVGRIHLVFILSQLLFNSIYSPPISNWLWHHPVGWLHPVSFWVDNNFSPSSNPPSHTFTSSSHVLPSLLMPPPPQPESSARILKLLPNTQVGRIHLVFILSQLLFNSIYSPPISNWLWHHPVGWLHPVSFWVDNNFSPSFLRWTWSHPVTLQFLQLHPKINPIKTLPRDHFFFVCRLLIITLEILSSSVSTNFSRASL